MHTRDDLKGVSSEARAQRLLNTANTWERMAFRAESGDERLTSFRIRMPNMPGDETMVVGRGLNEDGRPEVCFHSALGVEAALVGFFNRLANGTMTWHDDKYAT